MRKSAKHLNLKEYKALFPYLSRYRKSYALGIVCLIIVDAAQIIIPQFLKTAIDMIGSGDFRWKDIIFISLLMVLITAVISVGRFFWRYFINGSSRRIEAQLREDLFSHLQKLSWDFYQKNKIGDLMARSINDLHAVRMAIGMGIVAFFDFVFMASAILIIIFVQDAKSAMYAVIPLPVVTVLILVFGSMIGRRFRTAHESYSRLSDNVQEAFAGISVIKSFVKEWWFIDKFADSNDDYRKANMELVRLFGFFFPFIHFLSGLTVLIMLVVGGIRVINGLMTPGSLVAMFRYLGMLIWPLAGAGFMVNMIQRGAVALGRVNEILKTIPSIRNGEGTVCSGESDKIPANVPAIEILNLDFSYDQKEEGSRYALKGINLRLERGQWLGVMGKTGSGKSTLVKTFMRMVDPPSGTVCVFGLDVRSWQIEGLRKLFAVSPQDSYLFSDTIANNISYGYEGSDKNVCLNAIDFASLNKDLSLFQSGKDTLIGERGLTLSGGQKQRTAIARAVVIDSEFLVLDDSFSAVDNETELKILENLRKERKGRTTIIISHRVSTLKYSDKIAVLDNGKMIEYGSPSDLVSAGGFYSRTAAFQMLERNENG